MGFILAVGSHGIHGLRIVVDDQRKTRWFGSWEGFPKTQWLTQHFPVTAVEAIFDVSRISSAVTLLHVGFHG